MEPVDNRSMMALVRPRAVSGPRAIGASRSRGLVPIRAEASMEDLGQLVAGLEHFVRHYGVAAVMVILAFEALGAPLPGETLLIFASILAGRGEMSLPALLIFAWAGAVMGDNVGYLIGRSLGRAAVARYGAKIGLTATRYNAVEGVFARYGAATVVFARFVNVLRQLNGVVAGTLGMNWWRFLLFNALGGALWVATWVLGAYYLGEHASSIAGLARHVGVVGGMLAAGVLLVAVVVLLRRRRHGAHGP